MNEKEHTAAIMLGQTLWGQHGADTMRRYMQAFSSRRRCRCGCKTKVTHAGMANGVCLTSGCEWKIRKWVARASVIGKRTGQPMDAQGDGGAQK